MHYSCRAGSLEVAKWLWRHLGTHSITERSSYDTPLLLACAGATAFVRNGSLSLGADAIPRTPTATTFSEAFPEGHECGVLAQKPLLAQLRARGRIGMR